MERWAVQAEIGGDKEETTVTASDALEATRKGLKELLGETPKLCRDVLTYEWSEDDEEVAGKAYTTTVTPHGSLYPYFILEV